MSTHLKPTIVQPGCGQDLNAFGGGPPVHVHPAEGELFLVDEGRISHFVDKEDCRTLP